MSMSKSLIFSARAERPGAEQSDRVGVEHDDAVAGDGFGLGETDETSRAASETIALRRRSALWLLFRRLVGAVGAALRRARTFVLTLF
jgi:hypothetical protein